MACITRGVAGSNIWSIDWLIDWCRWDEMSQNRGHHRTYCSSPRVICERGEPWWWWCRLGKPPDSSTRALWQSYQQIHLWGSRRNGRRSENFSYQYVNGSLACRKILRLGLPALLPIARKVCYGFLFLKSIASARFEPATLVSSGKQTNHYTTEVTIRTPAAIRNEDWCFHVRVYKCCAGLRKSEFEGIVHSLCVVFNGIA
jgi:hypothetical protein